MDMLDIASLSVDRYDMIRVANVLNNQYFPRHTIQNVISQLAKKLALGGHLCIVRTDEKGKNHGTIFELDESRRLTPVHRLGAGSEVEVYVSN